jgi:hypothetical protein
MCDPPPQQAGESHEEDRSSHGECVRHQHPPNSDNQYLQAGDISTQDLFDSPPFWTQHDRSVSTVSYQSIVHTRPAPILLEDHSEEDHEQSRGCWAKSVTVDDYVIVSGPTGIGAYLVWNCTVSTLKGGDLSIRKR